MTKRIRILLSLCSLPVFLVLGCKASLFTMVDKSIETMNRPAFSQEIKVRPQSIAPLESSSYPLVAAYPRLRKQLFRVPLCDCPTPIQRLTSLEERLSAADKKVQLYIKNDGVSNSQIYGGNKVRKLELLLAQALYGGHQKMIISGTVGSHSAVATALYAKQLGIAPEIHLIPQLPSARVKSNLLAFARSMVLPLHDVFGDSNLATLVGTIRYHDRPTKALRMMLSSRFDAPGKATSKPFVCPPGATSLLSTLSYVNAMFELAVDVREGRLPKVPSRIFVPTGSGGTFLGLYIGTQVIPMFSQTEIVAVTSGSARPVGQYREHARQVVKYLHRLTKGTFPNLEVSKTHLNMMLDHTQAGDAYGAITDAAVEAKKILATDNIQLELTYTAKTVGRLIADARALQSNPKKEQVWLYWHTHTVQTPVYKKLHSPPVSEKDLQLLRSFLPAREMQLYGFTDNKDG